MKEKDWRVNDKMKEKDWTGKKPAVFVTHGATNHSDFERVENDYYATDPKAIDYLLAVEEFSRDIWECACGEGHLSKRLEEYGKCVYSSDLVYRGYGDKEEYDFLKNDAFWDGDIITNPPYKYALEFCKKALDTVTDGHKVAMFLKLTFLEGQKRRKFFDLYPPKTVYVFSKRINCVRNGEFDKFPKANAVCYAWFVWEKGWKGETVIKWIG